MKNVHTIIAKAVAAVILTSFAGFASAADTQDLNITASVTKICKFQGTAQTLDFGALDPSNAVATSGSGAAVTYKCTKGTTPLSVAVSTGQNGTNNMKDTVSGDLIPYTLTAAAAAAAGNGFGAGAALAVTFTSNVAGTDYADKHAGTYTDKVLLTINY